MRCCMIRKGTQASTLRERFRVSFSFATVNKRTCFYIIQAITSCCSVFLLRFAILVPLFINRLIGNGYRTKNISVFYSDYSGRGEVHFFLLWKLWEEQGLIGTRTMFPTRRSWNSTRSTWFGYWSTTEVVWGVSFSAWSIDQSLLSLNPSRSCC